MIFSNRKYVLPWWLKGGTILFLFTSLLIPIVIILAFLNYNPELAIYGFHTSNPFSNIGLMILMIYSIKGIVALGVFKEHKWAFKLGKLDAIIGLIFCILQFGIIDYLRNSSNIDFEFRLEILILIPYLLYLLKNDKQWSQTMSDSQ